MSIPVKQVLYLDEGAVLGAGKGLVIGDGIPSVLTNVFYQSGGSLCWNGINIPTQSDLSTKQDKPNVMLVTGTYTLSSENIVLINSETDCTIFLPPGVVNHFYRMRNIGPGRVTFMANGSNTIELASSYLLLTKNAFDLVFYSNNWYLL